MSNKKMLLSAVLMMVLIIGVGCRNKPPQIPVKPIGPAAVEPGDSAHYRSVTSDPNRDRVLYIWDWDDGNYDTTELMPSGDTVTVTHSWASEGVYGVRVRAKDDKGNFSPEWSDTLLVTVAARQNRPPVIGAPIGPDSGWVREWQVFKAVAVDPNGDSVKVKFFWDEGQTSLVSPLVASGDTVRDSVRYLYRGGKNIRCVAWDKTGLMSDTSPVKVFVALQENTAPPPPVVTGPARGVAQGPFYRFYARAIDPQGDKVRYKFFWGDGSSSEWTPLRPSGGVGMDSLRFSASGTYYIKAIAQDSFGLISETSLVKVFVVVDEGTVLWWLPGEDFISSPALGEALQGSELRPALLIGGTDERFYAYDPYQVETLYMASAGAGVFEEFASSPAIGPDGTVYIGNENGGFYALNTAGAIKWVFPETLGQNAFSSSAAVDGNFIYLAGEDGFLRKFRDNGNFWTELWSYPLSSDINSSPVILPNGKVVVVDDSGYVVCVNAGDGSLSWQYLINAGVASSPAVDADGNIYIGTDEGVLVSLTQDGSLRWTFQVEEQTFNDIYSSPVIDQSGNIYFGCENGFFYKVTPAGSKDWKTEVWSNASLSGTAVLTADGVIYLAAQVDSTTEKLCALNSADGSKRWEVVLTSLADHVGNRGRPRRLALDLYPSPVVDRYGIIYVASARGGIYAVAGRPGGYLMPSPWPMFRHDVRHTGKYGSMGR